jgi:ferredoxin
VSKSAGIRWINALNLGYLDFDHPVATDFRTVEERCITCGSCASKCPNEAMQIQDVKGERVLSLCGTVLNRQKLLYCENCGVAIGPARYVDYVRKRTDRAVTRAIGSRAFCEACAKKKAARSHSEIRG